MAGKFQIRTGAKGKFHFNLLSSNGQIVLTSQTYASRESALKGIYAVKRNTEDTSRFDRRYSKDGKPYFELKAKNAPDAKVVDGANK